MNKLISNQDFSSRPPRKGALLFCLAILAGGTLEGCAPSAPPVAAETKAGSRRQEMADFMKTQQSADGKSDPAAK